jgi:hypothetical protein
VGCLPDGSPAEHPDSFQPLAALEEAFDFLSGFMRKTPENDGKGWKADFAGLPS